MQIAATDLTMTEYEEKVRVTNLYKIFGSNAERAFALIEQGLNKDSVFEKTGLTIGVQNANFSVYAAEIFVVMGLSGSGKSTLVRMLNRLIEPTSGQIMVEGKDVARLSKGELIQLRRKNMSMVFQSFALMSHLTVEENVVFGLDISGFSEEEKKKRAENVLELVGLKAYGRSYPDELSGGMQQRVGLARGLAGDPSIMLMDEAFSALDPLIRTEMQDELLRLQQETPRTIIFISHDLDEAMRIGDRIAMMNSGKIVQVGTPEEILKHPADEYVQAFFRGVDPTNVLKAGDIVKDEQVTIRSATKQDMQTALERLQSQNKEFGYVLDSEGRFQGIVAADLLASLCEARDDAAVDITTAFVQGVRPAQMDTPLQEVLDMLTELSCPVPVVDKGYAYRGAISKDLFLRTLKREAS
jgi:glycine betaine/proline transport system ATP-binding protein